MNSDRPLAVDLFCGAGGMSLGLEQAGFEVFMGIDSDAMACKTHNRNFPGQVMTGHVEHVASEALRCAARKRDIALVCGGPPCQGFSMIGRRDPSDMRNSLVDKFVRIVVATMPQAVVMENVPGLASGYGVEILNRAVERLEMAGFVIVKPIRTLSSENFGVPQRRERLFLLGVRQDAGNLPEYPDSSIPGLPARPTVGEAIADLPDVDPYGCYPEDAAPYKEDPVCQYAAAARGLVVDSTDLSRPMPRDPNLVTGCTPTKHSPATVESYRAVPQGGVAPSHRLPRLREDGICPTLRAGSDSSRGSHTAPRPIHPKQPRCITVREAARLHGFPDWFRFAPTKWRGHRQIGNSVCPPVARAIGLQILKALGQLSQEIG